MRIIRLVEAMLAVTVIVIIVSACRTDWSAVMRTWEEPGEFSLASLVR